MEEGKKQKSVISNYLEMMLKFNEAFYEEGWCKKSVLNRKKLSEERGRRKTLLIKVGIEEFLLLLFIEYLQFSLFCRKEGR